jgi:hypothetical protein
MLWIAGLSLVACFNVDLVSPPPPPEPPPPAQAPTVTRAERRGPPDRATVGILRAQDGDCALQVQLFPTDETAPLGLLPGSCPERVATAADAERVFLLTRSPERAGLWVYRAGTDAAVPLDLPPGRPRDVAIIDGALSLCVGGAEDAAEAQPVRRMDRAGQGWTEAADAGAPVSCGGLAGWPARTAERAGLGDGWHPPEADDAGALAALGDHPWSVDTGNTLAVARGSDGALVAVAGWAAGSWRMVTVDAPWQRADILPDWIFAGEQARSSLVLRRSLAPVWQQETGTTVFLWPAEVGLPAARLARAAPVVTDGGGGGGGAPAVGGVRTIGGLTPSATAGRPGGPGGPGAGGGGGPGFTGPGRGNRLNPAQGPNDLTHADDIYMGQN